MMDGEQVTILGVQLSELLKRGITGGGSRVFMGIKGAAAVLGGVIVSGLGGDDILLRAMALFVAVDFCLGIAKAVIHKNLDSKVGGIGFLRKMIEFAVVVVAFELQKVLGDVIPLRDMTIMFYLCNEGLSIIENVGACGVEFPDKMKEALLQLKDKPELSSSMNKEEEHE